MAKVLKSKYNSTGERSVDACLNYGMLRYTKEDGSPSRIEIACDKYEEAISDFNDRVKNGLTETEMDPNKILNRGSITYNQAKSIAIEGKIKGIDFFEIDGSIECEHMLGISGSIEYALSLWNGESRDEALQKAVIRAIKVYGEEFIDELTLDNTVDKLSYIRFAKSLYSVKNMVDIELYKVKNYGIDNEIYTDDLDPKQKFIKHINFPLGFIGAFMGFIIVQLITSFGGIIKNTSLYLILNITVMAIFSIVTMKVSKVIIDKYIKNSNNSIMEIFNEELEKSTYDNLLTEKEWKLILKNITKGEISKLLMDMKGSVNKKISSNTIVTKETQFTLDARKTVILPSEYDIKETLEKLVNTYKGKLCNEYNIDNI